MSLEIKALYKEFNGKAVYADFSMAFTENAITCILGPSGCGKSTLLNMIGGILSPDMGVLTGFKEKAISYIFQDPRLLPWKTVAENIDFVLSRDMSANERAKLVRQFIELVELGGYANYYPSKLSGGMRQRVSIARAFAFHSDIILMDEPLKGLDVKLKLNLIRIFSQLWKEDRRTVIYVTHDVDEALLLGGDVFVLSQAPVMTVAHQKIDIPLGHRILDSAPLKDVERKLLSALGN